MVPPRHVKVVKCLGDVLEHTAPKPPHTEDHLGVPNERINLVHHARSLGEVVRQTRRNFRVGRGRGGHGPRQRFELDLGSINGGTNGRDTCNTGSVAGELDAREVLHRLPRELSGADKRLNQGLRRRE